MTTCTITDAADRLGVSKDTIRRRIRQGAIDAHKDEQGVWKVSVPSSNGNHQPMPSNDGSQAMVELLKVQMAMKDMQVQELHRLLAQTQVLLLSRGRPWWKRILGLP